MPYAIKARRFFRDGTEELITEPEALKMTVEPCTAIEYKVLDLLSKGKEREVWRLSYKLAVACIKSCCFLRRGGCNNCFFRHYCAYPKNPMWFIRKGIIRECHESEIKV